MMLSKLTTGDLIAGVALALSAYATWKTSKFNERQKSLIESQEKLNNLLLEKEEQETKSTRKADLGATFVKFGGSKYELKVWNKGKVRAKNVRIKFPKGDDIFIQSDIDSKFPLETMDVGQSVDLIAAVHMESKRKHVIKLLWEDDSSNNNEKFFYLTI